MSDQSDKQPIKKRSLSSYLSNVSSRKEELIKIAQKEKEKQEHEKLEKVRLEKEKIENEKLEKERIERDRIEKEKIEKERIENERIENERLEMGRLEQERIKNEIIAKERLEQEKQNLERIERERLETEKLQQEKLLQGKLEQEKRDQEERERERIENEQEISKQNTDDENQKVQIEQPSTSNDKNTITNSQSEDQLVTIPEIHTENISHIIHHVEKRNDDHLIKDNHDEIVQDQKHSLKTNIDLQLHHTKSHDTISRDTLKSLLKEPKNSDDYKESESDNPPTSTKQEGDFESFKEIESEGETEEGSPVKLRRGKLVRGDKMNAPQTNLDEDLMFANNSDSDLSDIDDDMKSVGITSSFLHDNSSPQKGTTISTEKTGSTNELFPSSPIKRVISSKDRNKSHIAVSKHSKTKKGLYRDSGGRTKLQIACDKGKIDTVKSLLAEGDININDQDNAGNTPLHEAALNGHIDIVKLLVEEGANINMQSYEMFQDTPLIDASANGHLEVVSYLLKNNADPTITNAKGMTAYEAIEEDSDLDESEKELVDDIKKTLRESTKIWNDEHESDANSDLISRGRHSTPGGGHENSRSGTTSRHDSSEPSGLHRKNGNSSIDKDHLTNEEIPFYWNDITTSTGKNKLLKASKEGNLAYVGQYLENGGRPDFKSFFEAVKFGHSEITSLFLAFGASINNTARDGITPLMIAVGRDHLSTVKLLLEAGADVLAKDKIGHNVLYYARNSMVGLNTPEEIELIEEATKKAGGSIEVEDIETLEPQPRSIENNFLDEPPKKEITVHKNKPWKKHEPVINSKEMDQEMSDEEDDDVAIPISKRTASPALNVSHDHNRKRRSPEAHNNDSHNSSRHQTPVPKEFEIENEEESHGGTHDSKRIKHELLIDGEPRTQGPDKSKKVNEETAEEKELRLKAEEEYRLRKIQNKKLKEQEMLHKMQEDEKKRDEEKAKQKVEQVKKLEEVKKQHELEIQKQEEEDEISRRRNIRSRYPLGLKIISDNLNSSLADDDYMKYLPLYFTTFEDSGDKRFILDLQLQIILINRHELFNSIVSEIQDDKIPISLIQEKTALWNMMKFIFLYGGSMNDNDTSSGNIQNTLEQLNIDTRLDFENQEFNKFSQLPLNWIPLDNILSLIPHDLLVPIESQMIQVQPPQLKQSSLIPPTTNSNKTVPASSSSSTPLSHLPIKLQRRHVVTNLCYHYRRAPTNPARTQRQFTALWQ
ncbi:similar to Saccharomyces cerevisiae YIL112W HOS4 Subunit of the Set3 complex, which is a meiotic-specific repressor of sporulation specific genes that contains deacetylase activity [Maudiozyma saulgeensis]|uniref:Similar to Saccharomyces cerevisiae YIL112W HOS4 Subunit of the Set3 complex, which is a meiotic-specific repressor of sporulation specific genes that contains deacetylase activity n=1 Tax=Maudiozyma saulgeensis TaxID=1789683 RepID=A0A1X7R514_9SACH|nr:similar to Saccharomyces cerevisiae YIL112W HOS4 Subunit of the Set3 complex, which is a meiotic-specific repressor of sporulation specific genes that contains deacetylase activity [Kazachstania saulgeensis]